MPFSLEPLRRIAKEQGALRVSDDACRALAQALEEETRFLVMESKKVAEHFGRKTVILSDVKLARKVAEAGVKSLHSTGDTLTEPAKKSVEQQSKPV
jgi:histone H3/H4